jgi:predicted flap endonuclease-1-like 5' DNA nuclease
MDREDSAVGSFLSLVIGVIVGVIGAWWFFERRDAQSRGTMEAGWKKKLEHVEAEVRRADAAHDETKERLRQLQQERLPAPTEPVKATEPAPVDKAKPTPATPGPATVEPAIGEAERIAQARRRIDAKLAQLPAGSSARQRLMAERAALAAGGEKPAGGAEQRLFTPPPEAPDDLERIRGIGPVLRQRLNRLGITTFAQIAAFTDEDLARVDEVLDFKGRIAREGWIEQAKALRDAT